MYGLQNYTVNCGPVRQPPGYLTCSRLATYPDRQPSGCLSAAMAMPVMDEVFKALADPSRRRLLDRLNERNGQTLRELCAGLAMARQAGSKHLAILEAANLVSIKWRGREKLHLLNPEPINAIAERWMTPYDRARAGALADLKYALDGPIGGVAVTGRQAAIT